MIVSSFLMLLAAQAAPVANEAPKKPKLMCKTIQVTGSRLGGKRTCMSAVEWDRTEREARALSQETQNAQIRVPLDN